MPFDATAWLSNNAAMRLSFACKGLWLDMLCCMWVSIERGVMMKPIGLSLIHISEPTRP